MDEPHPSRVGVGRMDERAGRLQSRLRLLAGPPATRRSFPSHVTHPSHEPAHAQQREGQKMKVKDLMTSDVKSCGPTTDLAAAAKIMWEGDCGAVPVID